MNGYCAILILLVVLSRPCICMKLVAKPTILEKKCILTYTNKMNTKYFKCVKVLLISH